MERNERWYSIGITLGPLLFLIDMNDLPLQITDGVLVQYADDTTLMCSGSDPSVVVASMNTQLQLIHNWITNSNDKKN